MSVIPGPAWLFCPADRPERYGKAAATADVVVLDLDDGVAPADKDYARRSLLDRSLDPRVRWSGSTRPAPRIIAST